jgi:hypothetical protein
VKATPTTILLFTVLAACGPGSGPTQAGGDNAPEIKALVSMAPVNVVDHGATPADDGIDERPAFAAAIATACARTNLNDRQVYVPSGNYTFTRTPLGTIDSIVISCDGLHLFGDGRMASTLEQYGTGMRPQNPNEPGAWKLLHVANATPTGPCPKGVVISDITLKGGERTVDTEEQTHLAETGCAEDTVFERVIGYIPQRSFPVGAVPCLAAPNGVMCETPNHGGTPRLCHADTSVTPPITDALKGAVCSVEPGAAPEDPQRWILIGWFGGGDCFRFFAEPPLYARRTIVRNVDGVYCDRSGIAGQRGVDNLLVENSSFRTDNDSPWDFEATGGGGLRGVVARNVTLSRGTGGGGGFTATFAGNGDTGLTDVLYDCNGGPLGGTKPRIPKGSVSIVDVLKVDIRNCYIDSGIVADAPTIDIRKRAVEVIISNSRIVRPPGAFPYAVVNAIHQSGVAPRLLTIVDSVIEQHTIAPFIQAQSTGTIQLVNTRLVYAAAPWSPPTNAIETAAISSDTVSGSPGRADSVSLTGVTLEAPAGAFASLVRMTSHATFMQGRGVVLSDVTVSPGSLRNGLIRFNGTAPGKIYSNGNVSYNAPALCTGTGCPAP